MKFMLLQSYAPTEAVDEPIGNWPPADIEAHIAFQRELNDELTERARRRAGARRTGAGQARRPRRSRHAG